MPDQTLVSPPARTFARLKMAGSYIPVARHGHVAAAVENKVYVWGGRTRSVLTTVPHDGPDKADIILNVDILDVKVSRVFSLTS